MLHAGVSLIGKSTGTRPFHIFNLIRSSEPELFHAIIHLKKWSLSLILSLSTYPTQRRRNSKCSTVTSVISGDGGLWLANFKKGACFFVPKAFKFSRTVAGQILTGWEAGRYGIPEDIIAQTDRATLWALACAAEHLNASGITDPYELYKYMPVHPSDVGT